MPVVKLLWTRVSKSQFDGLRQRATATGKLDAFVKVHNEIVVTLRDREKALEVGEPLYQTRKPGGLVRQWIRDFISVTFVVFPDERVSWITKYQPMPSTWPD